MGCDKDKEISPCAGANSLGPFSTYKMFVKSASTGHYHFC